LGQAVEGHPVPIKSVAPFMGPLCAAERCIDRYYQLVVVKRFSEEIDRTFLHGTNGCNNASVPADKNDGQGIAVSGKKPLKVQTVNPRHLQIKHEAGGHRREFQIKEFLG
jgi:hypothetical protein